ncbi:MAG TPA: class I SAM-dependent methyltransferase [Vicinamibacterales bacterium]|jgi:2-polyprenyl-3-methyl-5-hydroxy-6-metoxy-1,4-benzoquinol methylase
MSVVPGHYAKKQLLSASGLVRWSHGSRFRLARALVAPFAGQRLLDYGCGDGTFLALVQDLFPSAVGVDQSADQIVDCTARFAALPAMAFLTTDCLSGASHQHRYDIVVCMEVLEHCPDDIQREVLDRIQAVMRPGGTLVVSVPIEIGPPLLAKQSARALIAMSGLSEYSTRERYRPGELARLLCAGSDTAFPREEYSTVADGRVNRFTGHKGFNWRALQREVARRFTIERRLFSPLPFLGSWLNSQVWFVCRSPSR